MTPRTSTETRPDDHRRAKRDDFVIGFHRAWGGITAICLFLLLMTITSEAVSWLWPSKPDFAKHVVTDPDTGCQYIHRDGITPRLGADGKIVCN